MKFTDSHCHLDDKTFQDNLPHLLQQCALLNINRIIIPTIAPNNFDNVLALAKNYHNKPIKLHPCLGMHPWFLGGLDDAHLTQLSEQVTQERNNIVAVGEIGIDGSNIKCSDNPEKELATQQYFFDYQMNIAKQQNLPVIVHHRQSHQYIVPILKRYKLARAGIVHGFSGSYQQAKDYIDLGFKLGIGSTITYSRAKKTINAIKRLPLESLVLETDAPSMPLSPEAMGTEVEQVNSPTNLIKIFHCLVNIRQESKSDIAHKIERNIDSILFNIK